MILTLLLMTCLATPTVAATITGTVRDVAGHPLKGVRIDHVGRLVINTPEGVDPSPDDIRTNAVGYFRVTTDQPAFVIRTPGYESQRVRVNGDAEVQIVLLKIQTTSSCKLSPPPKVKTKKGNDVDYVATWFYVDTKDGRKGILSGSGHIYSRRAERWDGLEVCGIHRGDVRKWNDRRGRVYSGRQVLASTDRFGGRRPVLQRRSRNGGATRLRYGSGAGTGAVNYPCA